MSSTDWRRNDAMTQLMDAVRHAGASASVMPSVNDLPWSTDAADKADVDKWSACLDALIDEVLTAEEARTRLEVLDVEAACRVSTRQAVALATVRETRTE